MRRCAVLRESSTLFPGPGPNTAQCRSRCSPRPPDRSTYSTNAAPNTVPRPKTPDGIFEVDTDAKTVKTRAAGDLPLSPVMDPTFWERREQHKRTKPQPSARQNIFQRTMRKNPFAQALATPVRFDSITRRRMPTFFLQDFGLIAHPETQDPWWAPRSAIADKSRTPASTAETEIETGAGDREAETGEGEEEPSEDTALGEPVDSNPPNASDLENTLPTNSTSADVPSVKPTIYGPHTYVLARQDTLSSIGWRRDGKYVAFAKIFSRSGSWSTLGADAIWREDMDTFVLNQMREKIAEDLLYLSRLCDSSNRYYITRCYGWNDVQFKHKGAILWFGDPAEDGEERGTSTGAKPGQFATFDYKIGKGVAMTSVLVHNMPLLLGEKLAKKLRTEAASLKDGSIFMLAGRRTTAVQLQLWKLEGYMSDFKGPT